MTNGPDNPKRGRASSRRTLAFFQFLAVCCSAGAWSGCAGPPVRQPAPKGEAAIAREARIENIETSGVGASEVCFNGWDDNGNYLLDEGCGVKQGQVQVMLAWQDRGVDLDLFVVDPEGEIARAEQATHLGMTLSGDCPSSETGCVEQYFENAFLEEPEVPEGTYQVRVVLADAEIRSESIRAQLGIRSPLGTRAYVLSFFEQGQEVVLQFEVHDLELHDEPGPVTESAGQKGQL